jgi:hypothetical protein
MNYVIRHGRRIEVDTLNTGQTPERRRKAFEVKFVKVPVQWITALSQTKSLGTWRLAMVILAEAFRHKHMGGEIVLSSQVTRIPNTTRQRAARELASLGLIQLEIPPGKRAFKVLTVADGLDNRRR